MACQSFHRGRGDVAQYIVNACAPLCAQAICCLRHRLPSGSFVRRAGGPAGMLPQGGAYVSGNGSSSIATSGDTLTVT